MGQRHGAGQRGLGDRRATLGQPGGRLRDVPAAAVVETHVQHHAGVAGGVGLGLGQGAPHALGQGPPLAHEVQADAGAQQFGHFAHQRLAHQLHQPADFVGRAIPVLGGKGKHRQHLHAALGTATNAAAQRLDPLAVAGDARQQAPPRPTAIAVHHDGDVAREVAGRRCVCHVRGTNPRGCEASPKRGRRADQARTRWPGFPRSLALSPWGEGAAGDSGGGHSSGVKPP